MWDEIPKEAYAVIGTVLGALIALISAFITATLAPRATARIKNAKVLAARKDAIYRDLLRSVADASSNLTAAAHSMTWLTWAAREGTMTGTKLSDYDKTMNEMLPKIMASEIVVGGYDSENKIRHTLKQLVDRTMTLDADIGGAGEQF